MNKDYLDSSTYFELIDNPDVRGFLSDCNYLMEPSGQQIDDIKSLFSPVEIDNIILPENIIAIDCDTHESSIRKELPYTNIGYVKIASSLLKKTNYTEMSGNHFVDPFKIAKITKDREELLLVLPCSNISYKGQNSARDSFRLALEEFFEKVSSNINDDLNSLKDTLFWLFSYRKKGTDDSIILHKCPTCGHEDIEVLNIKERQKCPYCGSFVYATDCLRIYETVEETGSSNIAALGRLKNALKHIYLAHIIRTLKLSNKETYVNIFENLAFLINGTLSINGQPAWIHGSLMKIINEINLDMRVKQKKDLMIMGIANDGSNVSVFANMMGKHIDNETVLSIDDDFRNKFIEFNRIPSSTTFGAETYYGQDFIYKSKKSKMFVFNLVYPFANKDNKEYFKHQKSNIENYNNLKTALGIINEFESDMFSGQIVPLMLAEKYTAISLEPGATVLDMLTKANLS